MTVLRDGRDLQLQCEDCSTTTEVFQDFDDAVADARKNRWLLKPESDGWLHLCSDCAHKRRMDRQRKLLGL